MAGKTFNVYCDESTHLMHDGHPYMLYGYVSVAYNQIRIFREQIRNIKEKYGYEGELKWNKIHSATYEMYKEFVECFFSNDMRFRAVVVDKEQINESRPDYTYNDFYFRMYFQLLHHEVNLENTYNVYFDIKDTRSQKRLHELKRILRWNASINNFQFARSHESAFMQLADVLMGAINYNLRIDREDVEGNVIAKRKIVDVIQKHTDISLKHTSPVNARKFNLFFITLK